MSKLTRENLPKICAKLQAQTPEPMDDDEILTENFNKIGVTEEQKPKTSKPIPKPRAKTSKKSCFT